MVSLPSPAVLRAVAADIATVPGVAIFVDLSTSGPAASQAAAATLAPAGIALVDAPVSGGVKGAASGKLTLMISGPAAALERAQAAAGELRPRDRGGRQARASARP